MSTHNAFLTAVLDGLTADQKSIPCRFLYDARGSDLFVQITQLKSYYPTRAEAAILREQGADIARALPGGLSVVELGSGTSQKTPLLLEALDRPTSYEPVDIDESALAHAKTLIENRFPELPVTPIHADFTQAFQLPETVTKPVLGFFPGSTIGNFKWDEAAQFLSHVGDSLGEGAFLLIGADLVKDTQVLLDAYDDPEGVTAAFITNILVRMNRELGANVDLTRIRYVAEWDGGDEVVRMWLEAIEDIQIELANTSIRLAQGERIHVEDSHKYTPKSMAELGARSGWTWQQMWTDENELFSMHLLVR